LNLFSQFINSYAMGYYAFYHSGTMNIEHIYTVQSSNYYLEIKRRGVTFEHQKYELYDIYHSFTDNLKKNELNLILKDENALLFYSKLSKVSSIVDFKILYDINSSMLYKIKDFNEKALLDKYLKDLEKVLILEFQLKGDEEKFEELKRRFEKAPSPLELEFMIQGTKNLVNEIKDENIRKKYNEYIDSLKAAFYFKR